MEQSGGRRGSRARFQIDQDLLGLDSNREDVNFGVLGRIGDAAVEIERPCMPWAKNGLALDPSLAEGTGTMRAKIIKRMERAVKASEADGRACGFSFEDSTLGGCLTQVADWDPLRHDRLTPKATGDAAWVSLLWKRQVQRVIAGPVIEGV